MFHESELEASLMVANRNRQPTILILRARSLPITEVYSIFVLAATSLLLLVKADYLCETVDCVNGMFYQAQCSCQCIPPFCPDDYGNCIVSGTCEDPWAGCERGVNCPWWKNPSKAESCDTGPLVRSSRRNVKCNLVNCD